jgi:hypothetical protein
MSQPVYMPVVQPESNAPFQRLNFPGSRAQSQYTGLGPSSQSVLLKTAGNALQAVSRLEIHENDDLVVVCCPQNLRAGDRLRVVAPDGTGRQVETIVPVGVSVGHTFLVRLPPRPEHLHAANCGFVAPVPPPVATPVEGSSAPMASAVTEPLGQDLVLVKVPPQARPGQKLHVSFSDGRVIEAVVPPGVAEFYVRVPQRGDGKLRHGQAHRSTSMRRQPDQPSYDQHPTVNEGQPDDLLDDNNNMVFVQVPKGSNAGRR